MNGAVPGSCAKALAIALMCSLSAVPGAGQGRNQAVDALHGLVVSSGFVESRRISSGEPFAVWISFENQSGQTIQALRFVDFRMPGLEPEGTCWKLVNPSDAKSPRAPACRPDITDPTRPVGFPATLQPGEAVTATGYAVRGSRSGDFMLTGVYAWSDESGHQHRAMVPVGPIEIAKDWWNWRARLSEDLPTVLKDVVLPVAKDLAWPLVFFLLGWMFKAGEQKRSAVQQTWHQMLPKLHEHTMEFYLPVQSAAQELIGSLDPQSRRDSDEPFYFLALLFRRMRAMVNTIGGMYLKDRLGEDIAMDAWNMIFREFVKSFPGDTGIGQKEILVNSISEKETLSEYKKKLSSGEGYGFPYPGRAALARVQNGFKRWVREDPSFQGLVLPLLRVFAATIGYEINRPYASWYTEPTFFDATDFQKREKELEAWLEKADPQAATSEKDRMGEVRRFYKNLKRYRHRNTARPHGTRWIFQLWYRFTPSRLSG